MIELTMDFLLCAERGIQPLHQHRQPEIVIFIIWKWIWGDDAQSESEESSVKIAQLFMAETH